MNSKIIGYVFGGFSLFALAVGVLVIIWMLLSLIATQGQTIDNLALTAFVAVLAFLTAYVTNRAGRQLRR